ncbi:putative transporter [Cladophialophora carrionii]|uniref:Putative transporter n=1 Tax=Cladophialophora carrionii TaxID=86049 RepID=A0A1C1C6P1_9EURO|nr:putative transporter [Cladophialophora carrionii]
MAVTSSAPEGMSDNTEEKKTLPAHADPEATTHRDDPLALLSKIETSSEAHPIRWPLWKKWFIVFVYCLLQVFVTLTSTSYVSVEFLIMEKWTSSAQVATLGQSMFIVGTAVGPAFLGPTADIKGRKWVYVSSIAMYAILNIGTALAYNYPMLVIFCFLIGCAGSVALCNVAGTIADLFGDTDGAAQPMALFVLSANFGPSLGSPIGEWIGTNPSLGWRWIFYINIIIGGAFALFLCFMPETLPRIAIARAVKRRGSVDQNELDIAMGSSKLSVLREMRFVATMALRIMVSEPIVISLGLYNGFAYGLLFLYLDGVFGVFVVNNGLSYVGASLTYLNFCVGVTVTFCFVPVQTYLFRRHRLQHGHMPEARFLTSLVAVWLFPVSLFWFAWTCDGAVLGFCDPLLWLAMLNYITDSYPNVAASAIAAFLIPSFLIAAGCAHAGVAMFANMDVRWAFSTLGFISVGLVVLVYVLFFWGPALRRWSPLAKTF